MDEYDDLDTYNGDAVHDMWIDSDNYENTGTPDVFDEADLEQMFPRTLQGSYGVACSHEDIRQRIVKNKTESVRWFLEPEVILPQQAASNLLSATNEWGDNFYDFKKHLAENFGWTLTEILLRYLKEY